MSTKYYSIFRVFSLFVLCGSLTTDLYAEAGDPPQDQSQQDSEQFLEAIVSISPMLRSIERNADSEDSRDPWPQPVRSSTKDSVNNNPTGGGGDPTNPSNPTGGGGDPTNPRGNTFPGRPIGNSRYPTSGSSPTETQTSDKGCFNRKGVKGISFSIQTGIQRCSNDGLAKFWQENPHYNVLNLKINQIANGRTKSISGHNYGANAVEVGNRLFQEITKELANSKTNKEKLKVSLIYWTTAQHSNKDLMAKAHKEYSTIDSMPSGERYSERYLKNLANNQYAKTVQKKFYDAIAGYDDSQVASGFQGSDVLVSLPLASIFKPNLSRVNTLAFGEAHANFGEVQLFTPGGLIEGAKNPAYSLDFSQGNWGDANWKNLHFRGVDIKTSEKDAASRNDQKLAIYNKVILKRYADVVFGGYDRSGAPRNENPYLPWRSKKFIARKQTEYPPKGYPNIDVPPIYATHFAIQTCVDYSHQYPKNQKDVENTLTALTVIRDLGDIAKSGNKEWFDNITGLHHNAMYKALSIKDDSSFEGQFKAKTATRYSLYESERSNNLSPFSLLNRLAELHKKAITFVMGDGAVERPDKDWIKEAKEKFEDELAKAENSDEPWPWLETSAGDPDVIKLEQEWGSIKSRFKALKDYKVEIKNSMGDTFTDDALKIIDKYSHHFGERTGEQRNANTMRQERITFHETPKAAILEHALTCFDIKNSLGKVYKKAATKKSPRYLISYKMANGTYKNKLHDINPVKFSGRTAVGSKYTANFHGWWEHTDLGFSCRLLERIVENDPAIQEIKITGGQGLITGYDLLSGYVYSGKKLNNLSRYGDINKPQISRKPKPPVAIAPARNVTQKQQEDYEQAMARYRTDLLNLGRYYIKLIKALKNAWDDLEKIKKYSDDLLTVFDAVTQFDHLQLLLNYTPHFNTTCTHFKTQKIASLLTGAIKKVFKKELGNLHSSAVLDAVQDFGNCGRDYQVQNTYEDLHPETDFAVNKDRQKLYESGYYFTYRSTKIQTEPNKLHRRTGLPMLFFPGADFGSESLSRPYKEPGLIGKSALMVRAYSRANCHLRTWALFDNNPTMDRCFLDFGKVFPISYRQSFLGEVKQKLGRAFYHQDKARQKKDLEALKTWVDQQVRSARDPNGRFIEKSPSLQSYLSCADRPTIHIHN
ncbi:MAG: hypothetical protein OXC40_04600 [Proteobacteria bacterium]|nr:hypothetical protein [Pseudomonadota bacterium]